MSIVKCFATKQLFDQDWKTQSAKGYPDIPQGAEVEFVKRFNNFYGTFLYVRYNGILYAVKEKDTEFRVYP